VAVPEVVEELVSLPLRKIRKNQALLSVPKGKRAAQSISGRHNWFSDSHVGQSIQRIRSSRIVTGIWHDKGLMDQAIKWHLHKLL
jgi:hypothetical protein